KQIVALDKLLAEAGDKPSAAPLRRVRHALVRRAEVWNAIHALRSQQSAIAVSVPGESLAERYKELSAAITAAEEVIKASVHGPTWSKFLLLSELREVLVSDHADKPEGALEPIRQTLARYQRPGLTMRQRRYLRQPPLLALKNALLRVNDEPVDATRLM